MNQHYGGIPDYQQYPSAQIQAPPQHYVPDYSYLQKPTSSNRALVLGIVAGVVLLAGALTATVLTFARHDGGTVSFSATSGRRLELPRELPGYEAVPGVDLAGVKSLIGRGFAQTTGADASRVLAHGAVDVVRHTTGSTVVVFVGLALRDITPSGELATSADVDQAMHGMVHGATSKLAEATAPASMPAGVLGGQMLCFSGRVRNAPAQVCVWGDGSAVAETLFTKSDMTLAAAAAETRSLRAQIEHR